MLNTLEKDTNTGGQTNEKIISTLQYHNIKCSFFWTVKPKLRGELS